MSTSNSITVSAGYTLVRSGNYELLSSGGAPGVQYTPTAADSITVLSGGTTEDLTIGSGGFEVISSGGSVTSTTVVAGGVVSVISGGTTEDVTVGSGGIERIASNGSATSTTILNGGVLSAIGSALTLTGLTVSSGGVLDFATSNVTDLSAVNILAGGTIEFAGIFASASVTESANGLVTVTSGAHTETVQLVTSTAIVSVTSAGGHETLIFACYAGGTEILTEHGETPIEAIQPNDKVVVRRDGQDVLEPVTWVGSSAIDLSRHAHPERAAPIRVKAGALAENTPVRDLLLSPEHCLIIGNRCVPAKLLVNGGSIVREYRTEPFEYYHLELEKHGILIADGAEAESYLDTGNRSSFDNADAPQMLHPTFDVNAGSERWKTDACAPLASIEDEVAPLWQTLADRSAALGYAVPTPATVDDADLHILADGQRIQPMSDRDSRYVFTVPAGVRSVSLVSRFCIPADKMVSSLRDTRRLGVSVNWIAIRSGDHETILSADHPALRNGWNEPEQAGSTMWRWTNGAATIPWDNIAGAAVVTVRCTTVDHYPVYDEKLALVA